MCIRDSSGTAAPCSSSAAGRQRTSRPQPGATQGAPRHTPSRPSPPDRAPRLQAEQPRTRPGSE
eukprot:295369-Alexandrium_andersonii.AAC.1